MNQLTDRKRLRREYLRKKGVAFMMRTVVTIGTVPALVLTILLGLMTLLALVGQLWILACFMAIATFAVMKFFDFISKRSADLNYETIWLQHVPPVTTSTLPAEEILVRAADEPPVAQSEVLLRAAQAGQETPKEELLRVSQEG